MKEKCADVVAQAIGHALSPGMAKAFEGRVSLAMKLLAMKDPDGWAALPLADRMSRAADYAAKQMVHETQKAQQRVALQIAAVDRINAYLDSQPSMKPGDRLEAVSRLLDFQTKGVNKGGNFTSVASWTHALQEETFAKLLPTLESVEPHFFGLFENKQGVHDLLKELLHEDSGNAVAKRGAEVWHKHMDELRDRYNAAGGDVGKLDEWGIPQSHSRYEVGKAGFEKWSGDILTLLNRDKYINVDGSRMTDGQVGRVLATIYDSIITDGMNKRDAGAEGYGIVADRHSQHRAVFFKDSDSYLAYQSKYGDNNLWHAMTGHVRSMARDTAIAEILGPSPDRMFDFVQDRAKLAELRQHPADSSKIEELAKFNDDLYKYVTGRQEVVSQKLADRMQAFRNFETAVKLPRVIWTALTDEGGMAATAFANKVPWSQAYFRELRTLNPVDHTDRRIAEHNALGLNSIVGSLNRFGQEEFGESWAGKMANWVLHATGAERMWDARRQGLGSVLMSYLGKTVGEHEHFSELNQQDHGVLATKGVTENDWQVWRAAKVEDWGAGAGHVLTPNSIYEIPDSALAHLGDPAALRRHAATQLMAHVLEETGMGAMDTGPRQRVAMQFGTIKGTWGGELVRSMMLFKSFMYSMMTKHWDRAFTMPTTGGKWMYMARLFVMGTVMAAIGNQVRNLISGRDLQNMADVRFWTAAILRGGGMGFYGDFLYDQMTQHGNTLASAVGGPLVTTAEDIWNVTGGAAVKALKGERTDEGANLVRFGRDNLPMLNLWYTQAAMDHLLWYTMQDAASPGYLDRMRDRAQNTFAQHYWWDPAETLPHAAPSLSKETLFNPDTALTPPKVVSKLSEKIGID